MSYIKIRHLKSSNHSHSIQPYRRRSDLPNPCPGLAVLFNHNYINVKNQDEKIPFWTWAFALVDCYNFSTPFALFFALISAWRFKLFSYRFSVRDLATHGSIEHDASMTRHDFGKGDFISADLNLINRMLNALSKNRTKRLQNHSKIQINSSINHDTVTLEDFVNHKIDLQNQLKTYTAQSKWNVKFLGAGHVAFTLQALQLPQSLCHQDGIMTYQSWLKVWFEEERLPLDLGWRKPTCQTTALSTFNLVHKNLMIQKGSPDQTISDSLFSFIKEIGNLFNIQTKKDSIHS
ncbi:hypothetical protein O181_061919 [Austropuccinia psidii MF-1]|uniref:Heme haloperoxidase family profile domain-containing protein n=1 Tax=Austropuccinia psidii MF-1 TaxID=1389203 RepID=A0A9Q3I124_9BASI|nr:hypothetical protein [Austropuccinia psidii MF-1]